MTWNSALAGFAFSVLVGHLVVWPLMDKVLWPYLKRKSGAEKDPAPLSTILGAVERALYTATIIAGQPAFVAVWLGLKVAVHWRGWTSTDGKSKTRGTYNAFLIGNGMNVAFGYAGACIAVAKILIFEAK